MVRVLGGVVCVGYAQSREERGGFWATPKSCRGTIFLIWFRLWKLRPNRVEVLFFYPISTPPELCGGKCVVHAPGPAGVCVGGK